MYGTDFTEAVFDTINLWEVDFTHAKLNKARFVNANFFNPKRDITHQIGELLKYENHPNFDVIRAAVLDNFLAFVSTLAYDNDKITYLENALKTRFFGRPRTDARRNYNEFFAAKEINYAENAIYTHAQRRIRKEINTLRQKLKETPPLRIIRRESVDIP